MMITRRQALTQTGAGIFAAVVGADALSQDGGSSEPRSPTTGPGRHSPLPLPFNPAKLKGLSEKLVRSHHENNYAGAVKNLNKVEEELGRVTKDTPAFIVGGLKERELTFRNSMVLHELYFGNLGGDGKPNGGIQTALAGAYGAFSRWEEEFRATAASLGGGSGWVILDFELQKGRVRTSWSGSHSQTAAFTQPLLVMDMYEHSYQLDYGAAAAKYIDAFFQNIRWDEVNRRLGQAQRLAAALRG